MSVDLSKSFSELLEEIKKESKKTEVKHDELFSLKFNKYDENGNFEGRKCNNPDLKAECVDDLVECFKDPQKCFSAIEQDKFINYYSDPKYIDGPVAVDILERLGFKQIEEGSPYGTIKKIESYDSWANRSNLIYTTPSVSGLFTTKDAGDAPTAATGATPVASALATGEGAETGAVAADTSDAEFSDESPIERAARMSAKRKSDAKRTNDDFEDSRKLSRSIKSINREQKVREARGRARRNRLEQSRALREAARMGRSRSPRRMIQGMQKDSNDKMNRLNAIAARRRKMLGQGLSGGKVDIPASTEEILKFMVKHVNEHPRLLNPHLKVDSEGFKETSKSVEPSKLAPYKLSGGYLGELEALNNTFKLESSFIEQNGGAEFAPAMDKAATSRYAALNNSLDKLLMDLKRSDRALDAGEEKQLRDDLESLRKTERKAYIANAYLRRYYQMVKNGQVTDKDEGTFVDIVNKKRKLEKKVERRYLGILSNLNALAQAVVVVN